MRNNILLFIVFIVISLLLNIKSYSQDNNYALVAEVMPQPEGGLTALYQNIKYPVIAKKAGVSGKVYLQAFVNEKGEVDNVKIIKGIGSGCDEAAIEGVKTCKFNPAKNKGENVKARLSIAINF